MTVSGTPRLAIIVPAFGNWADTCECVQMLVDQAEDGCRIYLADDGSPEEPPARVHEFKSVTYRRGEHVGFAANCNRSAELAFAEGASHLLLLNNDTHVGPRFIRAWIAAARAYPRAILSPIIYEAAAPSRVWHSGGRKTVWAPFIRQRHLFAEPTSVDLVCGCCLLVPADEWSTLRGFDTQYTMYFEDFDLSLRAKQSGIDVLVLPDADLSVRHKVSGSFRGTPWLKERMLIGSRRRFIERHYSGVEAFVCRILQGPHFLSRVVSHLPTPPDWATFREALGWTN